MLQEEWGLADLLAAGVLDLARCDALLERWRVVVADEDLDVASVLRIELVDVLSQTNMATGTGYKGALLAARWLLGAVDPTLQNAARDTGSSTALPGLSERDLSRRGTRAKVAYLCLQQDTVWKKSTASPERRWQALPPGARVAFNKTHGKHSPRTRYVARSLHSALEDRILSLSNPSYREERFDTWMPALRPPPRAGLVAPDSVLSALRLLASENDSAASLYPVHMKPSSLARGLTFSDIFSDDDFSESNPLQIFGRGHTFGGKPFTEISLRNNRVVILGNPGGGKSTALVGAVVEALKAGRPAIFIRLTDLLDRSQGKTELNLTNTIQLIVSAAFESVHEVIFQKHIVDRLKANTDSLIALDGLDEVNTSDRNTVEKTIQHLHAFSGTIMVSSRWTGFEHLRGIWKELSLDSLNPDRATEFIKSWFGGKNAPGERRALQALRSRSQSELTRIPVLLGILAAVASEESVPATEALLYQRYIAMFLEGRWRPPGVRTPLRQRLQHLSAAVDLAWEMATGLTGRTDGRRWMDIVSPYELRSSEEHVNGLLTLANVHGLVLPHGISVSEAHQRFRWLHRTVHENLIGTRIASQFDADADHFGFDSNLLFGSAQWYEPLRHAVGLLSLESQSVFVDGLVEMIAPADAGSIMSSMATEFADMLPSGSAPRRRVATHATKTISAGYAAWRLDWSIFRERILQVYRTGVSRDMDDLIYIHWSNWNDVDEEFVLEISDALVNADAQPSNLVGYVSALLSKFYPDAALDLFFRFRPLDALRVSEELWFQSPSAEATARAISQIAENSNRGSRYRDLTFLLAIGAEPARVLQEVGLIDGLDVEIAARGRDYQARDQIMNVADLPEHLQKLILEGGMGSQSAFAATLDHHEDPTEAFARFELCTAAKLGAAARALRGLLNAGATDSTKCEERLIDIGQFGPAAMNDDFIALDTLEGLSRLFRTATSVPLDWCFEAHKELGRSYMAYTLDETFHSVRFSNVVDVAIDAVAMIAASHGSKVISKLLETAPGSWIASPPKYARFDLLTQLAVRAPLTREDKLAIIAWGAREDVDVLSFLNVKEDAAEIVRELWEMNPAYLVAGAHTWAGELRAAGYYSIWRDVIEDAATQWQESMNKWRETSVWPRR